MFIRFSALLPIAALAAVVAAAPSELEARGGTSQCNTGSMQCCNSAVSQNDPTVSYLAGLLGIVLPSIPVLVGLSCTPITVVGTGTGASCTQQSVCCTGNNFNGLINIGCTPININA